MSISEPKPTQVIIEGFNIKNLLDDRFVGILKKEFVDVKFQHICMYIKKDNEEEKLESITLAHTTPKDEEENVILIDVEKPETIKKLISIIKKYVEEE